MDLAGRAMSGAGGAIVILAWPAIGDFVRCHTLVQLVRSAYPDAPIDIVGSPANVDVARLMPEIREAIPVRFRHGRFDLAERRRLAGELKRRRYDRAYVVSGAFKAAVAPFLAGIPERIGWFGEMRYPMINRPLFRRPPHARYIERLAGIGVPRGQPWPELWPEPALAIPDEVWRGWQRPPGDGPVLMIAPGAHVDYRLWPIERFAELARRMTAQGWTVWITGSAAEANLAAAIVAAAGPRALDLTGTSLLDCACQLRSADVFTGNDSGIGHLAAGLGVPTVVVFGGSRVEEHAPINRHVRVVGPVLAARLRTHAAWPAVDEVEAEIVGLHAARAMTAAEPGAIAAA